MSREGWPGGGGRERRRRRDREAELVTLLGPGGRRHGPHAGHVREAPGGQEAEGGGARAEPRLRLLLGFPRGRQGWAGCTASGQLAWMISAGSKLYGWLLVAWPLALG